MINLPIAQRSFGLAGAKNWPVCSASMLVATSLPHSSPEEATFSWTMGIVRFCSAGFVHTAGRTEGEAGGRPHPLLGIQTSAPLRGLADSDVARLNNAAWWPFLPS